MDTIGDPSADGNEVRPRSRLGAVLMGLLVAAGVGVALYALSTADGGSISTAATPAGYYILLPEEPTGTDDQGLLVIDAATNLPEGTLYDLSVGSPDIEGSSGGLGVRDGLVTVRVANNACREIDGVLRSPELRVAVAAAPFSVTRPIGGAFRDSKLDGRTRQPSEVRAVLGDRFEHLWGDQVVDTDGGKMLTVERDYQLAVETCTHKLEDTEGGGLRQIPLRPPRAGEIQHFPWCPDLEGTLPLASGNLEDAEDVALSFDGAIFDDEAANYRALVDPVVRFPSDWHPAGGQEPGLPEAIVLASFPAVRGEAVARSCGDEVAQRTWQVILSDHDNQIALVSYYLVLRAEGWKVWGSLEGHGEESSPYGS